MSDEVLTTEQMWGKYMRLRLELAEAATAGRWQSGRIHRLVGEIVDVQRALVSAEPADEQTSEMFPSL